MPTPDAILRNISRLARNIRAGTVPTIEEIPDLAADWSAMLGDVADADLDAAVIGWLRGSCPFWPTPGQVLALVPSRRVAAIDDSADVWEDCLFWLRQHGYRAPLEGAFSDDLGRDEGMHFALRAIGGVRAVRMLTDGDRPHAGRRFVEAYKQARERDGVEGDVARIEDIRKGAAQLTDGRARSIAMLTGPERRGDGRPR